MGGGPEEGVLPSWHHSDPSATLLSNLYLCANRLKRPCSYPRQGRTRSAREQREIVIVKWLGFSPCRSWYQSGCHGEQLAARQFGLRGAFIGVDGKPAPLRSWAQNRINIVFCDGKNHGNGLQLSNHRERVRRAARTRICRDKVTGVTQSQAHAPGKRSSAASSARNGAFFRLVEVGSRHPFRSEPRGSSAAGTGNCPDESTPRKHPASA